MMIDFNTIDVPSKGEYKEKGSRFVAYAYPVDTELAVKEVLKNLWDTNTGACHVCYAYRIGVGVNETYRANDDGEPSGSAGKPIYGQLLSFDVTNVLVAVVRFYGGTKLGVGGLMSAYKIAAKESLSKASIKKKKITKVISISFGYDLTSNINRIINQYELIVNDQIFDAECKWELQIAINQYKEVEEVLKQIQGVTINR